MINCFTALLCKVDADGETDINDFGKLFESIRGAEGTVDALGSENQGFAVGSRYFRPMYHVESSVSIYIAF